MQPSWPRLSYRDWQATGATLQRYAQIVGKIGLALTPRVSHFWNCALHLTARGLTSGPLASDRARFELELDLVDHQLRIRTGKGEQSTLAFEGRSVAALYRDVMTLLSTLGVDVTIDDRPVELLSEKIPFHEDRLHAGYDPAQVERFWTVLSQSALLFEQFRARFVGKSSPVHFWWGSFDLALTRFSGRSAPARPGVDAMTREAYSHECWSGGFWPGDARYEQAAFYAYAAPPPAGFATAAVEPASAGWNAALGEFILPYDAMRGDPDPRAALLAFLQSSYAAAADLGGWDRRTLERADDLAASGERAAAP